MISLILVALFAIAIILIVIKHALRAALLSAFVVAIFVGYCWVFNVAPRVILSDAVHTARHELKARRL